MSKIINFNPETAKKLKKGVDLLANAVKVTLGPKGRNVMLGEKFGAPHVTKDGATVAKKIEASDPIENMGVQLVKEVASQTADTAGDGTTTATVLTQAIFSEGIKNVAAGANPMDIKRGIDLAVKAVGVELDKQHKPIDQEKIEEIKQIAAISANNDQEIGGFIAEAMQKIGGDGVITVEDGKSTSTEVKVVEGMQFDRGWQTPHFVTNSEKMTAELENPYILLADKKISNAQELIPVLEQVLKASRSLLIIAEDIEGSAYNTLIINRLGGAIKVVPVKSPAFGDRKKAILRDIAILTGAQTIVGEAGSTLEHVKLTQLGRAEKVIIDKDSTTLVNGGGNKQSMDARIKELTLQIEQATSDYDRDKLKERRAKLSSGVAILYVGAATEVEMKEKKDRIEDAINATKAAIEEGIVAGGGVALLRATAGLTSITTENEDQATGVQIVRKALEAPVRTILHNAIGHDYFAILQKIREGKGDFGYNARTGIFGALYNEGVVDPKKVTRLALEKSASVAALLLTTECSIADKPEENKAPQPPMPGGGMRGMM